MPAVKTGMTNVAGHFCSYIETVSQAVPAAMSLVHRRHKRTTVFLHLAFKFSQSYFQVFRMQSLSPLGEQQQPSPSKHHPGRRNS